MQVINNPEGRVRLIAAVVGLAVGVLSAAAAFAQSPLIINVHVDGVAGQDGNGNYPASSYNWGEPGQQLRGASPQLTFSQSVGGHATTDGAAEIELMNAVATHQKAATADVQLICNGSTPVVFIDYHLTNARFYSISDHGLDPSIYPQQPLPGTSPLESVTLGFKQLVYTYQPILPNCQKNGPPVSYTWTF